MRSGARGVTVPAVWFGFTPMPSGARGSVTGPGTLGREGGELDAQNMGPKVEPFVRMAEVAAGTRNWVRGRTQGKDSWSSSELAVRHGMRGKTPSYLLSGKLENGRERRVLRDAQPAWQGPSARTRE